MKRLPLLVSFIALVALSASLAYWALQLFQPPQRAANAAPALSEPEPSAEAGAGLFGGRIVAVAISNYQLKGVVAAGNGRGSVAILSTDSKPPQAFPVGAEVVPGVSVKEVQARFVLLSEGGVVKRVELAQDAGKGGDIIAPQPQAMQPPPPVTPQMAPPSRMLSPPQGGAPPPPQ